MKLGWACYLAVLTGGLLQAESAGGIQWVAPSGWTAEAARPMRAATYRVPPAPGDQDPGECAIFYFGPGQGGGVQANMDRWIGQFRQPDNTPSKDRAVIRKDTINGLPVTLIDLSGIYTGMGGPTAPTKVEKPGYRLLGAIVEGQQGSLFVKFTAPAKTVKANEVKFNSLVRSFRKAN